MARLKDTSGGCLGTILRVLLVVNALAGILLIALGLVLENPPKKALPTVIVAIGVVTVVATVLGCFGSFYRRTCLFFYAVLLGIVCFIPLLISTLVLLFSPEQLYDKFEEVD